jgi:DNA-binding NarL/FixJ family response regulator
MSETGMSGGEFIRPRVIVADDHSLIRKAIENVLSHSFDVVASVGDGREAIDAIFELDPDVVVLDIAMPRLDGFDVARELVGRGVRAKILFLTVHVSDEYVAAAVDAGVEGYVVKSRLSTDLEGAITHVLEGRLRIPTSSSLLGIADPRARHAMQLYTNDDARLDELSRFAERALRRGDVAVAVGLPPMLSSVASRLTDAGLDLTSLGERFQTVNSEVFLSTGDEPDVASIAEIIDGLERASMTAAGSRGVVVFGEIAPLLMREGHIQGALAVERAWHSHPGASRLHTLCSYDLACLEGNDRREAFDQVCATHLAVST